MHKIVITKTQADPVQRSMNLIKPCLSVKADEEEEGIHNQCQEQKRDCH